MESYRVILSLAGIVLIIIACYYVTYYIGVKASGQSRGAIRNKNINLIDRFAISKDKSFCLIEIAGKVYVIGMTNQSMTLLDTLDAAAFTETSTQRWSSPAWPLIPGGRMSVRLTKKLATFIARMMGRKLQPDTGEDGASFEDSMRNAREQATSGQPDNPRAERTGDPEGEQ